MITKGNISLHDIISQVEGNIASDMNGEKVMLNIENGKYYNLGEIGGEIWELIKQETPVYKLVSTLMSNYNVGQKECEEQVISFLCSLMREGLIELKQK